MKKIVVAIPHSHTFFWTQTCIACLQRNPPVADGYEVTVVVVDNSPWSPAIKGITGIPHFSGRNMWDEVLHRYIPPIPLYVVPNYKSNKFHASALDCIVEKYDFDLLMALETDVMVLRPTWLQWFVDQLRHTDYAVGAWHHEQFINPSCTLYRGSILRDMLEWCRGGYKESAPQDELRWEDNFSKTAPLDHNLHNAENPAEVLKDIKGWIGGPFAEKRGWPEGTVLKEQPSGQLKGPGWYEPGQQLHHWAVERGYTYTVCPTLTTHVDGVPVQTLYGSDLPTTISCQLEPDALFGEPKGVLSFVPMKPLAETVHLWGGTRALDIIKHDVHDPFIQKQTPIWLAREARFWRQVVPEDVQKQTLDLIRRYGWHTTGQGTPDVTDRDRAAAQYVKECYAAGGVYI